MRKKFRLFILFLILISEITYGQIDDSWKVYDDSEVAIVKISVDPADLQFMYDNPESDSMHVAQFHFKNAFLDEVVDSVGIRIRGNTSRISQKKSFKISFNTYQKGRKFYSLEKINLNGEHNDPTISRSKICWDFFNDVEVISTRAAHAAVYINESYYGLYISIEHIDENFISKNYKNDNGNLWKCLFGADLTFKSNNPNDYKIGSGENRVYGLRTNTDEGDYSKLAEFIDFINNSNDETFKKYLPQKINILGVLQYFAANVLLGSWDDYWSLSNNYYLYHDPVEDLFHLIPYDYDNTLGISWFNVDWASVNPYIFGKVFDGPRPLIERILSFPEFRNLFTHILEFFIDKRNELPLYGYEIYLLKNKIQTYAENDFYRTRDYGFTLDDFNRSFTASGYSKYHVNYSLQDFITKRLNTLPSQLNYIESNPFIYDIDISPKYIEESDTLYINCSVFSNSGIKNVQVRLLDLSTNIHQSFDMEYQPDFSSLNIKNNDLWKVKLSDFANDFSGLLHIIAEDSNSNIMMYPADGIRINTPGNVTKEVLISELMSSNSNTIQDNANEYDDWLEIYNPQDTTVILTGKYLTDKKDNLTKWKFPANVKIGPKQYILIWCDEDEDQAGPHINFKLSSIGEFVAIVDNDGVTIIDSVTIPALDEDESYARFGEELNWIKTTSPTPGENNNVTEVQNSYKTIKSFNLSAYPNPFNPSTKIEYEITQPGKLELKIFDVLGREVWSLRKENMHVGKHSINWNGEDNNGRELATGIYFLNLNSNLHSKTIKLILLR